MLQKVNFVKMHGLGNDFIIVLQNDIDFLKKSASKLKSFIENISDRNTGIGCDQFILYKNLSDKKFEMITYNSDGSFAEMCGNASRSLTHLIYMKHNLSDINIISANKNLYCNFIDEDNIKVDVGTVSYDEKWMPKKEYLWELSNIYRLNVREIMCVDVGNPHLVVFKNSWHEKEIALV